MRYPFILYLCIFCCSVIKGQDRKLDSLFNLLSKKETKDSNRVAAYSELCAYYNQRDMDRCMSYADTLIKLSTKIKHREGIVIGYLFSGNAAIDKADFKKAMSDLLEGEKNYDSTQVKIEKLAGLYNSMGIVYLRLRNIDRALYYYRKALNIAIRANIPKRIASGYTNLGSAHSALKQYDSAAFYARLALPIKLKVGDPVGIASAYANLAVLFANMNSTDSSLFYYDRAIAMYTKMGDKVHLQQIIVNKGITLMQKRNKYDDAITLFEKGLSISKEIGSREGLMGTYACISDAYKYKGDYRKAYEYYVLSSQEGDSIFTITSKEIVSEMEAKYQSDKKEKEIALLNKNKEVQDALIEKQGILNFSIIGGLILISIFALVLFNRLKVTRAQKNLIEIQKQEVEDKNSIIEDKQKEILDSIHYAKRIQNALLASEKYVDRTFKKLKKE